MTINTATLEINLRPIRLGFLVDPVDRQALSEVARVATCQWGGIACPMIPVMDALPPAWCDANLPNPDPNELTLGLLRYFEPDLLVETCAGQLDRVETRKGLEGERNALAEKLATVQEELRIARSDLERLSEAPCGFEQLLAGLRNPEYRDDIRTALSALISQSAPPPTK